MRKKWTRLLTKMAGMGSMESGEEKLQFRQTRRLKIEVVNEIKCESEGRMKRKNALLLNVDFLCFPGEHTKYRVL